jgi:hypothetical protein
MSWTYRGGVSANTDTIGTNVTQLQATLGFSLNLHDTVFVGMTYNNSVAHPTNGGSLSDNLGNIYVSLGTNHDVTTGQNNEIFVCVDVNNAGTPTLTLQWLPTPGTTVENSVVMNVDVFNYGANCAVDGHAATIVVAPGTGADAVASGTFPTTVDGDLVYTVVFDATSAAQSWSLGTGFTLAQNSNTVTGFALSTAYLVQSAHSASTQGTWTATVGTDSFIVNAGAVAPGLPQPRVNLFLSVPPPPFPGAVIQVRGTKGAPSRAPAPTNVVIHAVPPDPFPGAVLIIRPGAPGNPTRPPAPTNVVIHAVPPDPFPGAVLLVRPALPGTAAVAGAAVKPPQLVVPPTPADAPAGVVLFVRPAQFSIPPGTPFHGITTILAVPPDPFPGAVLVVHPAKFSIPPGNAFHGIVAALAVPPDPAPGAFLFVRPPGPWGNAPPPPVDTPRGPKVLIYTSVPSGLVISTLGPSSVQVTVQPGGLNITSAPAGVSILSGDP